MKKFILFTVLLLLILVVTACEKDEEEYLPGDTPKVEDIVTSDKPSEVSSSVEIVPKRVSTENGELLIRDVSQVIVDNESYLITFDRIEDIEDSILGNATNLVFEVTNRLNVDLTFQADDLLIDGFPVDSNSYAMSQDVKVGKTTYIRLALMNFEGYSVPKITNSFSLILDIFSWTETSIGEALPIRVNL